MDNHALDLLAHDSWLRPMVRSLVANGDVDDVLQDTWLAALRQSGDPDREPPTSIRAWLARVARNVAGMRRRSDRRRNRREQEVAEERLQPSTAETVHKLHLQARLATAVAELEPILREAVILRFLDGRSYGDIAQTLGVTQANARQRIKRGLDRLRQRLADESGNGWRGGVAVAVVLRGHADAAPQVGAAASVSGVGVGGGLVGVILMSNTLRVAVVLALIAIAWWALPAYGEEPPAMVDKTASIPAATTNRANASAPVPDAVERQRVVPAAATPAATSSSESLPLNGIVIDASGRAVAGVEIIGSKQDGTDRPLGVSNRLGRFSFADADDVCRIWAAKPYVTLRRPSNPERRTPDTQQLLVVARQAGFGGIVSDPASTPIEGVYVSVDSPRLVHIARPLDSTVRTVFAGTSTDELGRFCLAELPSNQARLRFQKPGYRILTVPVADGARLKESVVLQPLDAERRLTLRGNVFGPSGELLPNALVAVGLVRTQADKSGGYELELDDRILDRDWELFAASPGLQTFVHPAPRELFPDGTDVQFDIHLPGPIRALAGRVVDGDGNGVAGVHLSLWMEPQLYRDDTAADLALVGLAQRHRDAPGEPRVYAISDADGRFALRGLQDKTYRLRLRQPETWLAWTAGPFVAGRSDLEVVAPLDALLERVTGRVVDRRGNPVAGAEISWNVCLHQSPTSDSWSGPRPFPISDQNGYWACDRVAVADQVLWVVSGEDILVSQTKLTRAEMAGPVELVVNNICRFRVQVSNAAVKGFALRDVDDERVWIWERNGSKRTQHETWPLTKGRSPLLMASSQAIAVVLVDEVGEEVARVPMRLLPGTDVVVRN